MSAKFSQLANTPQVYFDKALSLTFDGVPNKLSYNLNTTASKIDSAVCNQIIFSEPQGTKLSIGNTFFLKQNRNQNIVVRSKEKIGEGNKYVIYDAYNASFENKGLFTEEEPKGTGAWLYITWNVQYRTEYQRDSLGNILYSSETGLPLTFSVPIGLWPEEETEIVVEYHSRSELDPLPELSSSKQLMVITPEAASRIESGDLVVSFSAPVGKLIDK